MRRPLTGIIAACAAAWLPAAEPAPREPATSDDPIAAAKRELDKTRAERATGPQAGKGGLPQIDLPTMPQPGAGGGTFSPDAQKKKPAGGAERKSANWLLEAMEKKDPRDARGRAEDSRSAEEIARADQQPGAENARAESVGEAIVREATGEARAEKSREEPRRSEPAPNPLARYMSEWMTPHDYALLKPVVEASARTVESPSAGPAIAAATPLAIEGATDARVNARAPLAPAAPQENPYLQVLNPPAAAPTPVMSAPPAPASPAPLANPPAIPAVEAPKNKVPDFAKPLDDQKYFKQLKRF